MFLIFKTIIYSLFRTHVNYIAKLRKYIAEDKQLDLLTGPKVGYKLCVKG